MASRRAEEALGQRERPRPGQLLVSDATLTVLAAASGPPARTRQMTESHPRDDLDPARLNHESGEA